MLVFYSENVDPYFNLAAESFFLNQFKEDLLLIWRSHNAVVCGKHQNVCAEVNYEYCIENNISVCRRLSGGGTVFHDLGNINFTFITNLKDGLEKAINYKQFLEPIREILFSMGVHTEFSSRDDLLFNDFKISGNAQHLYQKGMRILHHGTLLYDSDLESLNEALHSKGVYISKSIKSVRSKVTNIRNWIDFGPVDDFLQIFMLEAGRYFGQTPVPINEVYTMEIEGLKAGKFALNSWILGYSPNYIHTRNVIWNEIDLVLELVVEKGYVRSIEIKDTNGNGKYESECKGLLGKELNLINVQNIFSELTFGEYIQLF